MAERRTFLRGGLVAVLAVGLFALAACADGTLEAERDALAGEAATERSRAQILEQQLSRAQAQVQEVLGQLEEAARTKADKGRGHASSAEQFRLAEQYSFVHVAAASVHLAVESADVLDGGYPDGAVLLMSLERVWHLFRPTETVTDTEVVDRVMEVLGGLHADQRLFSHWPIRVRASSGEEL